ncbi:MAG TPA: alpha/beta fold hydrolase [Candidatus Acidoferrales bacterium]|nr:alpha/beta fold hydrolase [Candidatus Acidoferrales bacterium]
MFLARTMIAIMFLGSFWNPVRAQDAARSSQQAPPSTDEAVVRQFIADVTSKNFSAAEQRFTERMAQALPPEKFPATWNSVLAQFGEFQSIEGVSHRQAGEYDVFAVNCKFARLKGVLTVTLDAQQRVAGFNMSVSVEAAVSSWTAPAYVDSAAFTERAITFGASPWILPGTLSMPKGAGPFPAIVLVHGSGTIAGDQDETYGPNKTFKDLAWGLSSRGIAVLRYTKRTRQYSATVMSGPEPLTTKQETIDDARAAVAFLATQAGIDPKHIFLAGHSLGGYLAPRIASGDPQIAGLIILAGSTRPLEDMVLEQIRAQVARQHAEDTPQGKKAIADAENEKRIIEDPSLKPGTRVTSVGVPVPSDYFLDLRGYDPVKIAQTLQVPMLILQGEKDIQVSMVDFMNWKAALGSRKDVTLKSYPLLSHMFMPVAGAATGEEYNQSAHVEPGVIEDVAAWVKSR